MLCCSSKAVTMYVYSILPGGKTQLLHALLQLCCCSVAAMLHALLHALLQYFIVLGEKTLSADKLLCSKAVVKQ